MPGGEIWLKILRKKSNRSGGLFEIDKKAKEIEELDKVVSENGFWNDQKNARKVMARLDSIKGDVKHWKTLAKEISDLAVLKDLAEEENDDVSRKEAEEINAKISKEIELLEIETKLSGEFDKGNAIVAIHAGAGGTESCDWAEMLLRMYTRWAEKKGFETEIVDILCGEEAGVKSVTFFVKGEYAYGLLQSELGVHRLVRISPFDANKRRHTSFASVDVLPEIDENIEIKVEEKELRIDTYRASGHGGQYMNKTDSAVRITHLPTGIVVQSQKERSQLKNRVTAMKLLIAKLYELEQEKKRKSVEKHYDEKGDIAWGNQIRSYVFMPYQLVKDHRTEKEVPQVNLVMDGELDDFISSYLERKIQNRS